MRRGPRVVERLVVGIIVVEIVLAVSGDLKALSTSSETSAFQFAAVCVKQDFSLGLAFDVIIVYEEISKPTVVRIEWTY